MAAHSNSGLPGIDRTDNDSNSYLHPNNFGHSLLTKSPSTASKSSAARRRVAFEGESIAESSGTRPTSVGSYTSKPRASLDADSHEERTLHRDLEQETLGFGGQFGNHNDNVGTTTSAIVHPPTSDVAISHHRQNKPAWVRMHQSGPRDSLRSWLWMTTSREAAKDSRDEQPIGSTDRSNARREPIGPPSSTLPASTPPDASTSVTTTHSSRRAILLSIALTSLAAATAWTICFLIFTLMEVSGFRNTVLACSICLVAILAGGIFLATGNSIADTAVIVADTVSMAIWDMTIDFEQQFA